MRALVLGGTGFIGRAICRRLDETDGIDVVAASRSGLPNGGVDTISLDATNGAALERALADTDILINCVTGSGEAIADSADNIAACAEKLPGLRHIIHMSSMAVYGDETGLVDERLPLPLSGNWYARAKRQAEQRLIQAAEDVTAVTMLRIGCVYGPASPLWVDRIGQLIRQKRLGDLGDLGDGWSNLVYVNDIAEAVALIILQRPTGVTIYNFAAPDSPRWNVYFRDLALAIDCVPLRYKTKQSMLFESYIRAPIWKGTALLLRPLPLSAPRKPIIPPSLLRLWGQQIRLSCAAVEHDLDMTWTGYEEGLAASADHFRGKYGLSR